MFKILGSSDPKYLAATDLLIGDMSNINYEFLLFDRPIVLLANDWIYNNFPDIGIKTGIDEINSAIVDSLSNPDKYKSSRKFWLNRTIDHSEGDASKKFIDIAVVKSGLENPSFKIIHGNNLVRKTNLLPLVEEIHSRGFDVDFIAGKRKFSSNSNTIIIGAHFIDLPPSIPGYKVHIDHDLKGVATANLEYAIWDYKRNEYFPHIDLHIVTGKAGEKRTKLVLGPLADRTIVGGYPKGDHLLKYNTEKNKNLIYDKLGLQKNIPLVTYAPAGRASLMKPGGSLNKNVILKLKEIAVKEKFHVLIKVKYDHSIKRRAIDLLKSTYIFQKRINDDGSRWQSLFDD
jgi:hypothetical protein